MTIFVICQNTLGDGVLKLIANSNKRGEEKLEMKEDNPNVQQLLYIFDKEYFNILGNMLVCLLPESGMNRLISTSCLCITYGAGVETRLAWLDIDWLKNTFTDTSKAL